MAPLQEFTQFRQVVPARHERGLDLIPAQLPMPDDRQKSVAEAAASLGILDVPALLEVGVLGLGGAAVPDPALSLHIGEPEVAEVAAPGPRGIGRVPDSSG